VAAAVSSTVRAPLAGTTVDVRLMVHGLPTIPGRQSQTVPAASARATAPATPPLPMAAPDAPSTTTASQPVHRCCRMGPFLLPHVGRPDLRNKVAYRDNLRPCQRAVQPRALR